MLYIYIYKTVLKNCYVKNMKTVPGFCVLPSKIYILQKSVLSKAV